jgi:hypothetical protein
MACIKVGAVFSRPKVIYDIKLRPYETYGREMKKIKTAVADRVKDG